MSIVYQLTNDYRSAVVRVVSYVGDMVDVEDIKTGKRRIVYPAALLLPRPDMSEFDFQPAPPSAEGGEDD